MLFKGLDLRLKKEQVYFFSGVLIIGFISMMLEGAYWLNYLLSVYLVVTPVVFMVAKPHPLQPPRYTNLFDQFFKYFTYLLVVVNISAAVYALFMLTTNANPEDIFTGLYGGAGFGSHSLAIINLFVSAYYFFGQNYKKFAFFFICGILGFYGQGLVIFLISFAVVMIPFLIKNFVTVFKIGLAAGLFFTVVYIINPNNFNYIRRNTNMFRLIDEEYSYKDEMNKMKDFQRTDVPRFYTFLDGSKKLISSDAKVLAIGTSPGTYNSRVAFYLNGDFINNSFIQNNFNYRSVYHDQYIYPILNRAYLKYRRWNDGTRNQPFSSVISVVVEYGLPIGITLMAGLLYGIFRIRRQLENPQLRAFVLFTTIYVFLLMFFQYYLEVIEVILPLLLMMKLIESDQVNRKAHLDEPSAEA